MTGQSVSGDDADTGKTASISDVDLTINSYSGVPIRAEALKEHVRIRELLNYNAHYQVCWLLSHMTFKASIIYNVIYL